MPRSPSLSRGGNDVLTFVATGLVGVGYAGCQVFPMAMLPDVAAVDAARTGENRAGVYTGVWTAGETFGLALGPALFALLLALGGYLSSEGREITQPDSALTAIALGFSIVPAALTLGQPVVAAPLHPRPRRGGGSRRSPAWLIRPSTPSSA